MTDDIFNYAIKLLSKKDYFEKELKDKLISKFGTIVEVENTLKRLKDLKYIDDSRITEQFIRSQLKKGNGEYLIKKKLEEKGVDLPISYIKEMNQNFDLLKKNIFKKLQKYQGDFEKTVAYFYRKGYSYNLIKKLILEVKEDESNFP